MKRISAIILTLISIAAFLAGDAYADASFPLTVEYGVSPINNFAVSDAVVSLAINSAVAGSQPTSAVDTSSTYDFTTNETSKKITAQMDSNMPDNTALKVTLAVPSSWTSAGQVTLSADSAETVSSGDQGGGTSLQISYELSASVTAGIVASNSRTVTYTLCAQ